VDLDGTLAHYEYGSHKDWSPTRIGEPIPAMVERVRQWLEDGREVRIFTARVQPTPCVTTEDREIRDAISIWCDRHIGVVLPITCVKDYSMIELWDDRAVQVRANTGEPVGFSTRGLA
jgi:hypothetical protein